MIARVHLRRGLSGRDLRDIPGQAELPFFAKWMLAQFFCGDFVSGGNTNANQNDSCLCCYLAGDARSTCNSFESRLQRGLISKYVQSRLFDT